MDDFLKVVGCIVMAIIAMSFPVLCTLSFIYEWIGVIQFILGIGTVLVAAILAIALYFYDGGE